ncbi:MAG: hypothetical protein HUU31_25220 [Anaerolineae bacterium]|nr:hypothetical protein [Anaerolineae bacterium]
MEAAFLDRPTIHIGFDGNKKLSYWRSVLRYYDREHCVPFVASRCGRLVKSADELKAALIAYLADPLLDYKGREQLVSMICYKRDGKSGERIGSFVADVVLGDGR